MSSAHPFRRYHSLDALRAAMMLLGLVIHSGISYYTVPLSAWPYQDPQTSIVFDWLVSFIHIFRMPLFFLVAGFFAAMLWQRDGLRGFVTNRVMRVLVPLAIFWVLVYPPIRAGFEFANSSAAGAASWTPMTSPAIFQGATLAHLWFLYDLLFFYAAAALLIPLAARAPESWKRRTDDLFGRIATSIPGALLLSGITALTLLPMSHLGLDTSVQLLPPIRVLVAYGVFFGFGLLLFRRRDVIEPSIVRWKTPLAVGLMASACFLVVDIHGPIADPSVKHLVGSALGGLAMWMLIFGMMGAFVCHLGRPNPTVRYFADAAYWMYIVHLPFTIWIPGLLATVAIPAVVKFVIVLAATTAVTTVSYHYLVRATFIGVLLNGRRYPRGFPAPEPARAPVVEGAAG
jgi:glucans biosynthesis protein C